LVLVEDNLASRQKKGPISPFLPHYSLAVRCCQLDLRLLGVTTGARQRADGCILCRQYFLGLSAQFGHQASPEEGRRHRCSCADGHRQAHQQPSAQDLRGRWHNATVSTISFLVRQNRCAVNSVKLCLTLDAYADG
jgi:hypothetical protein